MTIRTLAVGNGNTNQVDHRSLVTSLVAPSSSVNPRFGFFPSINSPGLLGTVSAMVASVGPFRAIVQNTVGSGHFLVQSDASVNITFDPGEAAVTRTDRIIVRVYNNAQDASGQDEATVEYLKGQSSGSPAPLPDNSLLMWEVNVPAGASAGTGGINFTSARVDKRVYTTASGGIIPVETNADVAAITNPYDGMSIYVRSTDMLYVYDGSAFRPQGQIFVASASNLSNVLNPVEGNMAWVRDLDTVYAYNGSAWVRVGISSTAYTSPYAEDLSDYSFNNTSASATATSSGTAISLGVSFVAPPSGTVFITVGGNISSDQNTNSAQLSYIVRTGSTIGSGTSVVNASAERGIQSSRAVNGGAPATLGASRRKPVTGLTPGSAYNAQVVHWITPAGGGSVTAREIFVEPAI